MEQFLARMEAHQHKMLDKALKFQLDSFSTLPKKLHHYLPDLGVLKSVLSNREMWASHAYDMADKKELRFGAELLLERIEICKKNLTRTSWAIDEFFKMAADVANPYTNDYTGDRHAFILSLTVEEDSPYQWENYARGGTGYCLDFDVAPSNWQRWMREQNLQLVRVRYDRDHQAALIDELLKEQIDFINECSKDPGGLTAGMAASVAAVEVLQYYVMSFKQDSRGEKDYSAENEWRLVYGMREFGPQPLTINTRPDGANQKRYVKISLDAISGFVTLSGIRSGEHALKEMAAEVDAICAQYFAEKVTA